MQQSVQQRLVPPPRPPPPPPNLGASAASPRPGPTVAIPVSPAVPESPASPVGSAYSPTDTPTKRITPSPPPYSQKRLACDRSYYVARQDHQFALPADCPDNRPARPPMPFSAANPPLQPAPEAHRERVRRRAPSPPKPVGRGRRGPYVSPLFHLRIRHLAALHCLSHVPGTCLRILYQTFKVRPLLRSWSEPLPGHLKLPGPRHRRLLKFLHQELHHQTFFFRTVSTQQASG